MADKIWIALEPDNITVDAGGPPLTILVAVQNMSTTVDHLIIEVEGLNPGWFALSGDVLHLFPEERGQSQLQLQVPSGSEVRAGSYPFTVRARSRTDPAEMGTARGTLEVRPYYSYQFDVTPRLAHGRQGSFRATIQNTGIAEIEVQLRAAIRRLCAALIFRRKDRESPPAQPSLCLSR